MVVDLSAAQQPRLSESEGSETLASVLATGGTCEPDAETLCLHDGRYEVQVDWRTGDGNSGAAQVVPKATRDSGLFRFFDADNWEVLIKVLGGCAENGHHWVYGASTTDLGYEIRVRDTATDDVSVYRNEPGRPAPAITDGKAFQGACRAGVSSPVAFPDYSRLQSAPGVELAAVRLVGESDSGCVPSDTTLCLVDSRFEVSVDWSAAGGGTGAARTVPGGTNNSGLFYFFEPDNWEMLIKVLDGCQNNGHYWVYSAAATDLGLDITVLDTATGATWNYEKGPGPPAPAITESKAFPDSCGPLPPVLVSPGSVVAEHGVWRAEVAYDDVFLLPFAADFDGDGDDDVMLAPSDNTLEPATGVILINNGDFTFEIAAGDRPHGVNQREILMADFDGDGRNDFFIPDHGYDFEPFPGWHNQLLLWTENGYLDATDRLPPDPSGYTHNAAVGDIDGDGDIDILVANVSGDSAGPYFLLNDGQANFVADWNRLPTSVVFDWNRQPWAAQLEDLDGDGHVDLLAGATGSTRDGGGYESFVYWGSAAGEYREEDATALTTPGFFIGYGGGQVVSTAVHDFNEDGRPDILLGGYDVGWLSQDRAPWRGVQLLVNHGERQFVDETSSRLGRSAWAAGEPWHVEHRFVDFNGDGTIDIVPHLLLDPRENVLAWLNDGTGRYAALKLSDFGDSEEVRDALGNFAYGPMVRVGGVFKYLGFNGDGTYLEADAGVVVRGAVVRPRR